MWRRSSNKRKKGKQLTVVYEKGRTVVTIKEGMNFEQLKELVKNKLRRYLCGKNIEDIVMKEADDMETVVDDDNLGSVPEGSVLHVIT